MEPIYEFLLWNTCKNNCKFCHQKANKGKFPGKFPEDEGKYESIKLVEKYIKEGNCKDSSDILMMGGELFDTKLSEKTERAFMQLIDTIFTRLHNRKVFHFYFNSNLIYEDMSLLYKVLDRFFNFEHFCKNGHWKCFVPENLVYFTTSYDIAYRFYTKEREDLWKNNMLKLHEIYPELRVHTETILTQFFIDAVNNDSFSITDFCNKYHTRIDYIEPGSGLYYHDKTDCSADLPGFFPTKSSFIKFIQKVIKNGEIEPETFLSMELRSSKLYYIDDGRRFTFEDRRKSDGRGRPFDKTKKYEIGFIDSEDTMKDVVNNFMEIIG